MMYQEIAPLYEGHCPDLHESSLEQSSFESEESVLAQVIFLFIFFVINRPHLLKTWDSNFVSLLLKTTLTQNFRDQNFTFAPFQKMHQFLKK